MINNIINSVLLTLGILFMGCTLLSVVTFQILVALVLAVIYGISMIKIWRSEVNKPKE